MGFLWSSPQVDTTVQDQMAAEAAAARQREEQRAAAIRTGQQQINTTFGGFGEDFYKGREKALLDYYQPQLNDQFSKARDALTYAFARAGTLNSTMAGQRSADLTKQYDLEKAGLVSNAESDAANLRNSVTTQKSSLLNQLNASGDATQAADNALAATQQIYAQRPVYSPLGNLFTGITQGVGNYIGSNQAASFKNAYFGNSGNNAVRTVR